MNDCVLWEKGKTAAGYGVLQRNGKKIYAHRDALERRLGRPIAPGMCACHACDVRSCVNPNHIFEGSPKDNTADMIRKHGHYLANRTHCIRGHVFDEVNTYTNPYNGQRVCIPCRTAYLADYYRAHR